MTQCYPNPLWLQWLKFCIYLLNYAPSVFNKDYILLIFLKGAVLFMVACGIELLFSKMI